MPTTDHRRLLTLTLVGAAAHALSCWPYIDFYPDDSYIYAQFVRVFVEYGEVAFNPGEAVYGVTSAAHFWLWAIPLRLLDFGGRETVMLWGKLLTSIETLLWIGCAAVLVRRISDDRLLGGAAMVVLGCHVWPARWHLSGMETALADLCFVGFLAALAARRPVTASIALGLLHFARPETVIWIPLWIGFAAFVVRPRRGGRAAAAVIGAYGAVGVLLAGSMLVATGAPLPNTATAKSALLSFDPAPLVRIAELAASSCGVELALLAAATLVLWRRGELTGDPRARLVVLFVAVLIAFYWLRGVSLYTRYVSFLYALPILAATAVVSRALPRWRPALLVAAGVSVALNAALSLAVVAPATRAYMESMERVNRPIAALIRETTAPGDVAAVADIGLIGFESERPTFDVVGLVSPEMLPVKWDGPATRALFDRIRPKYFVNVTERPGTFPFPGPESIESTLVERLRFDHMFVRERPMYYEVYRLEPYWDD